MKKFFLITSLSVLTLQANAQTYLVPNAQVQPAWAFPLWFEDGSGARDTLFFCYDSDAHSGIPYDTIFGEHKTTMDTSLFNVYYDCSFNFSTLLVRKTMVTDTSDYGVDICVWHASLPLKIKWDKNLLYSDSLPFPDQSPAPRARGYYRYDIPMLPMIPPFTDSQCYIESPILMTDTVTIAHCYSSDSIVFDGYGFSVMNFSIGAWNGYDILGLDVPENNKSITVSPTIFNEDIKITNGYLSNFNYLLTDLFGIIKKKGIINPSSSLQLHVSDLSIGIYILIFNDETLKKHNSFKLIKISSP